ncbi:hypothetical protein [Neorhizobium sp. NCHU2750]|uniref:hypothetical protein n=1 Tax=Neorhizobium sp. NCHU2750 TaxID=1825976 RepID=UPI000EB75DC0|nr:hypothetical protein NCHU2750_38130 [Neorhizobium sp. NCHU2750]
MSKMSENERLKLKATALDRISTVVVSTAFIVPLINITIEASGDGLHRDISVATLLVACAWIIPSALLHLGAAEFLKGLQE